MAIITPSPGLTSLFTPVLGARAAVQGVTSSPALSSFQLSNSQALHMTGNNSGFPFARRFAQGSKLFFAMSADDAGGQGAADDGASSPPAGSGNDGKGKKLRRFGNAVLGRLAAVFEPKRLDEDCLLDSALRFLKAGNPNAMIGLLEPKYKIIKNALESHTKAGELDEAKNHAGLLTLLNWAYVEMERHDRVVEINETLIPYYNLLLRYYESTESCDEKMILNIRELMAKSMYYAASSKYRLAKREAHLSDPGLRNHYFNKVHGDLFKAMVLAGHGDTYLTTSIYAELMDLYCDFNKNDLVMGVFNIIWKYIEAHDLKRGLPSRKYRDRITRMMLIYVQTSIEECRKDPLNIDLETLCATCDDDVRILARAKEWARGGELEGKVDEMEDDVLRFRGSISIGPNQVN